MLSPRHLVPVFSYLNSCTTPIPKLFILVVVLYVKHVLFTQNFKMSSGPFPSANSNLSSSVLLLLLIKFLSYNYHIPLRHPSPSAIISLSSIPLHLLSYPSPPALSSLFFVTPATCVPSFTYLYPSPPAISIPLLLFHVTLSYCYSYLYPSSPANIYLFPPAISCSLASSFPLLKLL